jgi:hypothetical protein
VEEEVEAILVSQGRETDITSRKVTRKCGFTTVSATISAQPLANEISPSLTSKS